MKKRNLMMICSVVLITATQAFALSELDQEIDRLSVEMRPSGHFNSHLRKTKVKNPKKSSQTLTHEQQIVPSPFTKSQMIAVNDVKPPSAYSAQGTNRTDDAPAVFKSSPVQETSSSSISSRQANRPSLFSRFSFLPFASIATFDGGDSDLIIPHGVSNQYTTSFSGAVLTDLDFGYRTVALETGISYLRAGSNTAYQIPLTGFQSVPGLANYIDPELVTLHYVGIPINVKWMLGGLTHTSLYGKLGVMPSYLIKSEYNNLAGAAYLGYRFGTFNQFDAIGNVAVGADINIYKNYGIVVEGSYFHGVLPVSPNYSIMNTGFTAGLGLTYVL